MNVYEKVLELLKDEYANGATYQELAQKYGVSYTHIRSILLGERPISGLSLKSFFQFFPHASISLTGGTVNVSGTVNGNIDASQKNFSPENNIADFKSALIAKIMASPDFNPETKVAIFNLIQGVEKC